MPNSHLLRKLLNVDILAYPDIDSISLIQKRRGYSDWIMADLIASVEDFFSLRPGTREFCGSLNRIFNTDKFNNLARKYVTGYLYRLYLWLDYCAFEQGKITSLKLGDIPLNRFAVNRHKDKFGVSVKIEWVKQPFFLLNALTIFIHASKIVFQGASTGFIFTKRKKRYKVLREMKWGFKGVNGRYFHDDFMVDGENIRRPDLLIFIRQEINDDEGWVKMYQSLKESGYGYFDIGSLPIALPIYLNRIIKKYLICGCLALSKFINSADFSLFSSIYFHFFAIGILHEKIFSSYKLDAQLGHHYFSYEHIPEAIVCNNHNAGYFLCQLSDNSVLENKPILPFMGCDKILAWGDAHAMVQEGNAGKYLNTGYAFKRFIEEARARRDLLVSEMRLLKHKKNIVFFEENFGGIKKETAQHYIDYWQAILQVQKAFKEDINIIIKRKGDDLYLRLPPDLRGRYIQIISSLNKADNFYELGFPDWSFIELIGVADIVITSGMTSSATIAIICGIEGLYFDRAGFNHPFSKLFKNQVVFDNERELIDTIGNIIYERYSVFDIISADVRRSFNSADDNCGMDMARAITAGSNYNYQN